MGEGKRVLRAARTIAFPVTAQSARKPSDGRIAMRTIVICRRHAACRDLAGLRAGRRAARRAEGSGADRKAPRRDQLRQRRAGAEGHGRRAQGITPDLPRALAKRLGVAVEFVHLRGRGQGVRGRQGRRHGMSASSRSSRCAPPRSSSPRPMSSSTAPTWCGRICR